jgi:hypothetical protein
MAVKSSRRKVQMRGANFKVHYFYCTQVGQHEQDKERLEDFNIVRVTWRLNWRRADGGALKY